MIAPRTLRSASAIAAFSDAIRGIAADAGSSASSSVARRPGSVSMRQRDVKEPAASLTAEVAIAVFKIAFERWVDETNQQDLPQLIRDSLDELKALTAGG